MNGACYRPKVLCVRPRRNPASAAVLDTAVDEWVHTLALHCDVEMIEQDFDLLEVYARIKPDFLLFDAIHWGRRHRVSISNIQALPDLPRALLFNSDPHDPMRPLTMEMVAANGIDTIFSTGTQDLEQMKELRRFNCFVLPKFIDSQVFRDYGEARTIPMTIMGAHLAPNFYPWRAKITEEIQRVIPTLAYPHPGYEKGAANPFEIRDERYARMLSRSQFCISDTTRLDYLVRKHLEIPAAGSVLVAPASAALSEYGFADMENCILGEPGSELYNRIIAVARDQQLYERIRASGHALVHAKYTRNSWTHIVDWYRCRSQLKPGEMIQQERILGSFRIVRADHAMPSIADYHIRDNPMSKRLREVREALFHKHDLGPALDSLQEMIGWLGHAADPWLLIGIALLCLGETATARQWIEQRGTLQGREDPVLGLFDPCEIAWLMLIAYMGSDEARLDQLSKLAANTSHVSIRRMQWLIAGARPVEDLVAAGLEGFYPEDRLSMHWVGDEDFNTWFKLIHRILATMCKEEAA